ncbi:MAG: RNA polymerase sigma factor [Planctomycetota bacterium]
MSDRPRPTRPTAAPPEGAPREEADLGAAWMAAWNDGDETAFEALVEAYSGRVFALLTRFLGPVPEREDLTQEVFLRVVRARDRYEPTARFSTWLYRIVFNLSANQREKARLRRTQSLDTGFERDGDERTTIDPVDEQAETPDAILGRDDRRDAVRAAIDALPEKQRMALILAKYDELPYVEIGEVLEMSEKAVKSLIHRAREGLRRTLAPLIEEDVA